MLSRKRTLLSTTMAPLMVVAGVAVGGVITTGVVKNAPAAAQCAPKKVNPCNPCAAKKANPCNPCAAKNPCNPCAASASNPCNPCNPCAAGGSGGASKACLVPRLQAAAKANPCAAKKASNPCNPCNPCAAKNPCNPCAAKKANPCNPCAASTRNPCNPCAASASNPYNPCNPCGAAGPVELTDAEAVKVYDCLSKELKAAYAKSDNKVAVSYAAWPRYSKQPYVSETHGSRFVQNYANSTGRAYGNFEKAGTMPAGTALAKDSFSVDANGQASVGPLFVMEKMNAGFNAESGDWRYTMIMPDGSVFGTTKGAGDANVQFCAACHMALAEDTDSMLFMPEEYRVSR